MVAAEIESLKTKRTREVSSFAVCVCVKKGDKAAILTTQRSFSKFWQILVANFSLFLVPLSFLHKNTQIRNKYTTNQPQQRLEAASKGLQVHVIGLSIHHADVEVRERLAVPEAEWNAASAAIVGSGR